VSEILLKTFEQFESFTDGMRGKNISFPTIFGVALRRNSAYVLLAVALVLVMMLTYNLTRGQFGRAMHACRGSESAAQAMGVNLLKYRLIVFALSTAYSGLAGALYVFFIRGTYPTTWTLTLSLNILAAVVVGGFRSIYGTVIGAFFIWSMSDLVLKKLPVIGDNFGLAYILDGVLIILILLFYPGGIVNIFSDVKRLLLKLLPRAKGGEKDA
jgi:branched-chain amino acid transport system permease protein